MKNKMLALAAAILGLAFSNGANAQTAIGGTGNPDGWPTQVIIGDLLIGVRAKAYQGLVLANAGNVYFADAGAYDASHAKWNIEPYINTNLNGGGVNLAAYSDLSLWVDTDPGLGTVWNVIDLKLIPDNAYGNNSTANSAGVVGLFAANGSVYNILTQSENPEFNFVGGVSFNSSAPGLYGVEVHATMLQGPSGFTHMDVQVAGGPPISAVPEPSTYGMFGALALLAGAAYNKRRKAKVLPFTAAA